MKVRATALCYYNLKRRRKGDVFALLNKEDFNDKCMEDISKPLVRKKAEPKAKAKQAIRDADGTIVGYKDGKPGEVMQESIADEVKAAQEAEMEDQQFSSDEDSGHTQSDQSVI